jgi:hypothetical protein
MYDFLFELTCGDNEGEFVLCEAENLDAAYWCLVFENGFEYEELRFVEKMETWEGELLGLDTY